MVEPASGSASGDIGCRDSQAPPEAGAHDAHQPALLNQQGEINSRASPSNSHGHRMTPQPTPQINRGNHHSPQPPEQRYARTYKGKDNSNPKSQTETRTLLSDITNRGNPLPRKVSQPKQKCYKSQATTITRPPQPQEIKSTTSLTAPFLAIEE